MLATGMFEEDTETLRTLYKECKESNEKLRYQALYAVSRGKSINAIAEIMDVERSTIHDWINRWKSERNIKDRPRSGRPSKLAEEDDKEMDNLLNDKTPKDFGINSTTWTTRELRDYFIRVHHKYVDEETIRHHLHMISAHYVKGQLVYKEADMAAQVNFSQNVFELMTTGGFTRVIFLDEMSVSTSAHKGYGWTTHQRLLIPAVQSHNERANCFIAVDVMNGEITEIVSKSAKVDSFMRLLNKIERRYNNEKTLICMDNGRVHKAQKVGQFFKDKSNMKVLYTSPYSPELNPQEYINGYLRNKLFNNRSFKSVHQIGLVMGHFVRKLDAEIVKSVATLIPIETMLSFQM